MSTALEAIIMREVSALIFKYTKGPFYEQGQLLHAEYEEMVGTKPCMDVKGTFVNTEFRGIIQGMIVVSDLTPIARVYHTHEGAEPRIRRSRRDVDGNLLDDPGNLDDWDDGI